MVNESVLQYWNRIKQYWGNIGKSQKITLIAMVLLLCISIPLIVYYFSRTVYTVAFTDLQPTDAASITAYLDSSKIAYELSPDGKNISVPQNQVASVKINVESQGLNKNGSIGYESLKDSAFGSTDNEWSVKKLSMVQGELQQLLNSFQPVASSKVMITMPERSVFLKDDAAEKSSAAVVVKVKPGYTLDQQKVDTMYNLVSKSIKNLPIENITISEQSGELLPYSKANGGIANSAYSAATQFQIKKQFEQDIQNKVKSILGGVLGQDKVIPLVVASLNFDQKTSSQKLVTPVNTVDQKGIEISVQEIQKNYSGDGAAVGGTAGTGETDVPNYPGGTTSGKTTSEEVQHTINYEVNRINNEIQSSPFSITDLTISVGVESPDTKNPASLTDETKNAITQLLINVVSASLANSGKTYTDQDLAKKVTVLNHNFASTTAADQRAAQMNWYYAAGIGAAALALAAGGGYFISRRRKRKEVEELADEPLSAPAQYPTIDLDAETGEGQVRKQLEMLAKKKPEEFVNLLRTWLVDE